MIQRIKSKKMFAVVPLVLLMIAAASGQIGIAQAYWGNWGWNQNQGEGGWNGGGYQNVCGGSCGYQGGGWYYHIKQAGYSQGFSDGNTGSQYDCSGHSAVYCASYGNGFANGQAQNNNQLTNNNLGNQQNQNQEQQSNSNSYSTSQSNPSVRVTVNNILPNYNNATAGATAPTDSGSGNQG